MEHKQQKFTIIVIRDNRKLYSFEVSRASLTVLMGSIAGLFVISLASFFFYPGLQKIFKNEPTAKMEYAVKSAGTESSEPKIDSTSRIHTSQHSTLAIENFQAGFNAQKKRFNYSFLLKNKKPESTMTSGYTFVILKSAGLSPEQWLTHPKTTLLEGIPQYHKEGDPFSISKYKIISKNIPIQHTYESATVFVFSSNGDLLLTENFGLKP